MLNSCTSQETTEKSYCIYQYIVKCFMDNQHCTEKERKNLLYFIDACQKSYEENLVHHCCNNKLYPEIMMEFNNQLLNKKNELGGLTLFATKFKTNGKKYLLCLNGLGKDYDYFQTYPPLTYLFDKDIDEKVNEIFIPYFKKISDYRLNQE